MIKVFLACALFLLIELLILLALILRVIIVIIILIGYCIELKVVQLVLFLLSTGGLPRCVYLLIGFTKIYIIKI